MVFSLISCRLSGVGDIRNIPCTRPLKRERGIGCQDQYEEKCLLIPLHLWSGPFLTCVNLQSLMMAGTYHFSRPLHERVGPVWPDGRSEGGKYFISYQAPRHKSSIARVKIPFARSYALIRCLWASRWSVNAQDMFLLLQISHFVPSIQS